LLLLLPIAFIDYLKYNLRSQMFAKALSMINCWCFKAFELLRNHPGTKDKLWGKKKKKM
jgi:glycine C-acetyltransferase